MAIAASAFTSGATPLAVQAANRAELERAAFNLAVVIRAAGVGSRTGLNRVGLMLANDWKRELSKPGTGVVYRRKGRIHRASAPGQPPAPDFGELRASVHHLVTVLPGGPVLDLYSTDRKSGMVEFGTRKMRPRPSLRTVVAAAPAKIPTVVAAEIGAAQRSAASSLGRALRISVGVTS